MKNFSNNQSKKRLLVIIFIILLSILLVAIIKIYNTDKTRIKKDDFNSYIKYDNQFLEKESKYLNDDGYVTREDIPQLLDEVEDIVKSGQTKGIIKEYTRENDNIYVEFSSGIKYLFIPFDEENLSNGNGGKILTVEPEENSYAVRETKIMTFIDKYCNSLEYVGDYSIDGNAILIKKAFDGLYEYDSIASKLGSVTHKYALTNNEVTIDSIKKWAENKIIIFEGHGGYTSRLHSCLQTNEGFVGFEEFSKYIDDIEKDNIVITSFPQIGETGISYSPIRKYCITSKFIDNYVGKMDNSLIFLGACSSVKDEVLAQALLDKGAAVVLGYNEDTSMQYEMMTRSMFFYNLTKKNEYNTYSTVAGAVEYAKENIALRDPWGGHNSELICVSKNNVEQRYTLNGILKNNIDEVSTPIDIEITNYFYDYTQLQEVLSMKPVDYWQFPDSESYMVDDFYLEWKDGTFSMKNEGASYVKLYGLSLGDSAENFDSTLLENGWIECNTSESNYSYITLIDNSPYYMSFETDENGMVRYWYLNNWPEGQGVDEAFSILNNENGSQESEIGSVALTGKTYEYCNDQFISDFEITESNGIQNATLMFWHDWGESASDEEFFFEWDDAINEYDVMGMRSNRMFHLYFEPTDTGIYINVTCIDDSYFSWQTGQESDEWVAENYSVIN